MNVTWNNSLVYFWGGGGGGGGLCEIQILKLNYMSYHFLKIKKFTAFPGFRSEL